LGYLPDEEPPDDDQGNWEAGKEWFYLPRQTPDEVLVIKLFDGAALGEAEQAAGAPCHGSPVLKARDEDGRLGLVEGATGESIETRVVAFFWCLP